MVTLITGQQVLVQDTADGPRASVVTGGADDAGWSFSQSQVGDQIRIVPDDARALVPDRLDPRLFDVTLLADLGGGAELPVIIELVDAQGASLTGEAATLQATAADFTADTGIEADLQLNSIGSISAAVNPAQFEALLDAVEQTSSESSVNKVWLSGPVNATLDESTVQIGAPEAWALDLTGDDVTVAVLDTGIDASHPDLDGRVIAAENFTDSPDVNDVIGHGTHVAGIVAGTGAANSDYTGVAYGAELLNGKVLSDEGGGEEAWIIAGMEWAVEEGAHVVNMSLGGEPTDGTDLMSVALNTLSEQTDTLFVVAAGNAGFDGQYTVGSPGAADHALTVGSVDSADDLAPSSSQGPRVGDDAIKPDVSAPGESIISALSGDAEGTEPIDEHYVESSGTSMAAPHVAGAAAILLQDQPDLTVPQLKALLMGSALSTADTVWEEGAGRIAIPAALDGAVYAQPASLSIPTFEYPHDDLDPVSIDVTFHNRGAEDQALDLTVAVSDHEGEPAPEGTVELGVDEVTVPASGTATVEVSVDPTVTDVGLHSGAVVGTGADDATVRIPLGFHLEPEMAELSLTSLDWDGAPSDQGQFHVFDMEEGYLLEQEVEMQDGTATLRVPVSTYLISARTLSTTQEPTRSGLIVEPNVDVTGDTEVVFDFADTELVSLETHRPTERRSSVLGVNARDASGAVTAHHASGSAGLNIELYTRPSDVAQSGDMEVTFHQINEAPRSRLNDLNAPPQERYRYFFFAAAEQVPTDLGFSADADNTASVTTVFRSMAGVEAPSVVMGRAPATTGLGVTGTNYLVDSNSPATQLDYISTDAVWDNQVLPDQVGPIPAPVILGAEGQVYEEGSQVTEPWMSQVLSTGLSRHTSDPAVSRDGDTLQFQLPVAVDADGNGNTFLPETSVPQLRVWADGELIGESDSFTDTFAVSADPASYRVLAEVEHTDPWWTLSSQSSTEWTFSSAHAEEESALPVLDLRFQPGDLSPFNMVTRVLDLEILATHQSGAQTEASITEASLEWSAGSDWSQAELTEVEPGRFHAQIELPPGVETVDLRGSATDSDGSSVTTEVSNALGVESPVTRVAGEDRYQTAAEIALLTGSSPHVYLASGVNYPDALAVGGIAGQDGAPVLLTPPDQLANVVRDTIESVNGTQVTILGGTAAVSPAVEDTLVELGVQVERIGGSNRYSTAALLAQGAPTGGTVFVASGEEYADALAAGPLNADQGRPVLLTRGEALPSVTQRALLDLAPEEIVLVGGESRVSQDVVAELEQIAPTTRIGGSHRYHTAALLAQHHGGNEGGFTSSTAYLAAGHDWADALALAAHAGTKGSPILLLQADSVPSDTQAGLRELDARRALVVGGSEVIDEDVLLDLEVILNPDD